MGILLMKAPPLFKFNKRFNRQVYVAYLKRPILQVNKNKWIAG